MGDMADEFKAYREYKEKEKQKRLEHNLLLLEGSGLQYTRIDEWHYHVVALNGNTASFWPSTGAWKWHTSTAKARYGWPDFHRHMKGEAK